MIEGAVHRKQLYLGNMDGAGFCVSLVDVSLLSPLFGLQLYDVLRKTGFRELEFQFEFLCRLAWHHNHDPDSGVFRGEVLLLPQFEVSGLDAEGKFVRGARVHLDLPSERKWGRPAYSVSERRPGLRARRTHGVIAYPASIADLRDVVNEQYARNFILLVDPLTGDSFQHDVDNAQLILWSRTLDRRLIQRVANELHADVYDSDYVQKHAMGEASREVSIREHVLRMRADNDDS